MRMKTTTTPMTMRMAGSMSASAAASAVATSSSKNSETELSICGQCAGLLADGDHLRGEIGEDAGFGERIGQAFAFAYGGDGGFDGLGDAARGDGAGSGFKRGHQRQAAGEQRGERASEESDLILEPDFAEDGHPDADAIDKVAAALGDGEAIEGCTDDDERRARARGCCAASTCRS